MKLNETIRFYRKQLNMTQEEMAAALGVSAPAVNKWEKGASCPDISLLAPLARLLDISLDTLLSYEHMISNQDIENMSVLLNQMIDKADTISAFTASKLYQHMSFKKTDPQYIHEIKQSLTSALHEIS